MTLEELGQAVIKLQRENPSFEIKFSIVLREPGEPPIVTKETPMEKWQKQHPNQLTNCQQCGDEFAKTQPMQKFCSDDCQEKAANARRPKQPKQTGICAHCSNPFTKSRRDQIYCKPQHREAALRARQKRITNGSLPKPVKYRESEASSNSEGFEDPWDCIKCRDNQEVCPFHQEMQREGQKPPKFRHN